MTEILVFANLRQNQESNEMPQIHFSEIARDESTYRFIAVDVETANSDNSSICQIGIAMVTNENQVITTSTLINPDCAFEPFNIKLHGINESSVASAPSFNEFMRAARPLLERHPLIQHSSFDKRAFEAAATRYGSPKLKAQWYDSVTIARRAWPELKGNGGHGLSSLKTHLGLTFDHHDAEQDAYAASMVTLLAEEITGETFAILSQGKNQAFQRSVSITGNQNGPLYGHVACFTGQLQMSRPEAATIAAGAGIEVKSGMSKKITLLVVGDQDMSLLVGHKKSAKHRKAEELISEGINIRIIAETEFLEIIDTGEVKTERPTHVEVLKTTPPPIKPQRAPSMPIPAVEQTTKTHGESSTTPPDIPVDPLKGGQHIIFKLYYAAIASLAALMGYQQSDLSLALFSFSLMAVPVFTLRHIWTRLFRGKI